MKKQQGKGLLLGLFVLYTLVMLWLLFYRTPRSDRSANLIPLRSIRVYWELLLRDDLLARSLKPYALLNFAGNVAAFFPLGVFLPNLFFRQQSFWLFLPTVIALVCLAELIQFATATGALDVDDLLLNVIGASLGWLCWKIRKRKVRG